MTSIDQLPQEEQQHFILCHCGHYIDMRNLAEVFSHQHVRLPEPEWSHSVRRGDPAAWPREGKRIDLN
jgi:hypothetical protein